jgi:hypothetical protein
MSSAPRILLFSLALTGWAVAVLPKKAPITKYISLWTNSPFTSKPPPVEAGPTVNPLEDYALAGVSPVGTGYRVTLLNKKKPEDRITVNTDNPKSEFKVLEVIRKAGDPLGTVVRMSYSPVTETGTAASTVTGDVSFDEKLLALAAPPATKVAPKAPPGVVVPGQPLLPGQTTQPGQAPRTPRPRVVPPVNPAAGQPTAQPGQPGSSSQPQTSGQPIQHNQRPIHRGSR